MAAHPAGSEPGATPLKFSAKIVVASGVPVFWLNRSVFDPCAVVTLSANSIFVPGTNAGDRLNMNGDALDAVRPGPMLGNTLVADRMVTPGVLVPSVADTFEYVT